MAGRLRVISRVEREPIVNHWPTTGDTPLPPPYSVTRLQTLRGNQNHSPSVI